MRKSILAMDESAIEKKFNKLVMLAGGLSFKWTGTLGCPDRIVIFFINGKTLIYFIELKAKNGKVRSSQIRFNKTLKAFGCNALILKGLEGINNFINEIKALRN